MGKWAETAKLYVNDVEVKNSVSLKPPEEKVIPEKDRMCLAAAFVLLHKLHDYYSDHGVTELAEALECLFHWVDEMSLLLKIVNGELDGDDQPEGSQEIT